MSRSKSGSAGASCAETGFQADHFRALAAPGAIEADVADAPTETLPLSPESLYGGMLFRAGRFRRVSGYAALSAAACVARIAPDPNVRWFPSRVADDLMLGDPGARDAALHALQATIPHRRVLPIAVRRIMLGRLRPDRAYAVHARETTREHDRFTFDLVIRDEQGSAVERWDGLVLQAVESLSLPRDWPASLLPPYVERVLADLLPRSGIRVGLAECASSAPQLNETPR